MSKKHKKKFYAGGLLFACTECGNCCTKTDGVVSATAGEAADIAALLNISDAEFTEKYADVIDPGETLHLKSRENGDCIFLEDERCTVYAARPKQCRTFPFWPENLKSQYRWNIVAEECPGIGQGRRWTVDEIEKIKKSMQSKGR